MLLVVGLGNPGRQYEWTRHNAGFRVVDYLVGQCGGTFSSSRVKAVTATVTIEGERVVLAKPQTFMNLSGQAVRALLDYYKLTLDHLLVVCDDVALPIGEIRFRQRGGSGGQKGLRHTIEVLQTEDFCRLRIGIDNNSTHADLSDYVLNVFTESERAQIGAVVETAATGICEWVNMGIEEVMNRYNRRIIG